MPDKNYADMTVDELQRVAREQGISGHSSMNKQELIDALAKHSDGSRGTR